MLNLKAWLLERQEGDDGTGHCDYLPSTCEDCDSRTQVKAEPYGSSYMATIDCPKCGVSYDTDLTSEDIEMLLKTGEN